MILIPIIIIIFISFPLYFIQKKYTDFIYQNSISLNQLKEINKRYNFYPYIDFNQTHTYDNEKYYDTISCSDFLIYQLQYISKNVCGQIEKVNSNKQQYNNYLNEIHSLQFGNFLSPIGKLNYNKLLQKEKQIIERTVYKSPVTQFSILVTLYCSKINGAIYNRKSQKFAPNEIFLLIERLNNKNGSFYNDKKIWDALCRVERGKVSNKMRFSIYERDGYQCCQCGVSERNALLEIDHIIPIAKGGKSTYDNLQTLCHNCNYNKGDKIYYKYLK